MTIDPQDRLLETFLEEALGGAAPPDLRQRILESLQRPAAHRPGDDEVPEAPPIAAPPVAGHQVAAHGGAPRVEIAHKPTRGSRRTAWSGLAWGGGVAVLAIAVVAIVLSRGREDGSAGRVAESGDSSVPSPTPLDAPALPDERPAATDRQRPPSPLPDRPRPVGEGSRLATNPPAILDRQPTDDAPVLFPIDRPPPAEIALETPPHWPQPLDDDAVIAEVDELLAESWSESQVETTTCTDEQWCRRVYLRMLGRIPTVEELQAFLEDSRPDRRAALVDTMQTGALADQYAAHWARHWANLLIGRRGGLEPGDPASREGLERYLAQAIREDRSYSQLAHELIAATGSGRPGAADYNGAANFLLANLDDKGVLATNRTMQIFHGKQLRCVQCHSHPSASDWAQDMFWQVNAFFRQAEIQRGPEGARLANRDFRGEGQGDLDEAEVYFQRINGMQVAAYPAFPGAAPISASGRVSEVDRREELARLIVASADFPRAAANQLWQHFLGFGFTRPVDDMGPHNPPTHPELLDELAGQFAAHDYSLRHLVRWIVLSDAFDRGSRVDGMSLADNPEAGGVPLFSRYYTRQLQPEAVYDSLRLVAETSARGGRGESIAAREDWLGQFIRTMGTDDGEERSSFGGDIGQSLIIMNGPLMRRATDAQGGGVLQQVATSSLPFDEQVRHLFLAAVARAPTADELRMVERLRAQDPSAALANIWWALLNSNEFILDH